MKKLIFLILFMSSYALSSAQVDFMVGRSSFDILKKLSHSRGTIEIRNKNGDDFIICTYEDSLWEESSYYAMVNNTCLSSFHTYSVFANGDEAEKYIDRFIYDLLKYNWFNVKTDKKTNKLTRYLCSNCNHNSEAKTIIEKRYIRKYHFWSVFILSQFDSWKNLKKGIRKIKTK